MHRIAAVSTLLVFLSLLSGSPPAAADEAPLSAGSQTMEGLAVEVVLPKNFDPAKEWSLFVVLHGNGGTATGMAGGFAPLAEKGFVVVAPKSTGMGWSDSDIEKVRAITKSLLAKVKVGEGRLHGLGFSNGGWNLAPLVFDESLPFATACWMAAGYNGGKVPRRAKTMACIALAGENDANRSAALKTVDLLADKVRFVECRIEPGIGHEFCQKLMPYYHYWLGVMEGRYEPGYDLSFEWLADWAAAKAKMAAEKRGGFVYFHSAADVEGEDGKRVQGEVFLDGLVQRFGRQLVPVKLDRAENEELFASFKLKQTPAVVVVDEDGKVEKTLEAAKIKVPALAKELRGVAKDKSLPKD